MPSYDRHAIASEPGSLVMLLTFPQHIQLAKGACPGLPVPSLDQIHPPNLWRPRLCLALFLCPWADGLLAPRYRLRPMQVDICLRSAPPKRFRRSTVRRSAPNLVTDGVFH